MSVFRNPGAWPRSIKVNGVEMPLTDREVTAMLDALNAWREVQLRGGRTHSIAGVAHFFATGELPEGGLPLKAWRREILASESQGPVRQQYRRRRDRKAEPPQLDRG